VCKSLNYRVGEKPGVCMACGNITCGEGTHRKGTCGQSRPTLNGFYCVEDGCTPDECWEGRCLKNQYVGRARVVKFTSSGGTHSRLDLVRFTIRTPRGA